MVRVRLVVDSKHYVFDGVRPTPAEPHLVVSSFLAPQQPAPSSLSRIPFLELSSGPGSKSPAPSPPPPPPCTLPEGLETADQSSRSSWHNYSFLIPASTPGSVRKDRPLKGRFGDHSSYPTHHLALLTKLKLSLAESDLDNSVSINIGAEQGSAHMFSDTPIVKRTMGP
jgi:hypothetical protein